MILPGVINEHEINEEALRYALRLQDRRLDDELYYLRHELKELRDTVALYERLAAAGVVNWPMADS